MPEGEGAWISCWITLLTLAVTGGHVNNPRAVKKILALLQIMDKHSGLEGAWWEVYTEKQAFIHHEFNTTAKPSGILWSQSIMNFLYSKAISITLRSWGAVTVLVLPFQTIQNGANVKLVSHTDQLLIFLVPGAIVKK